MSPRILMMNYEYPPLGGGAAKATQRILAEFAQSKDLRVDLVTSSVKDQSWNEEIAERIRIFYVDIGKKGNLHYQSNRELLRFLASAYRCARELCRRNAYDVVHAFFSIPCGFVASRLNMPYIISLRGSDVPFYNRRFFWLDALLFRHLNKVIWRKAAFVVANSEGLKELALRTSPGQDILVIPNGIDGERYKRNDRVAKENVILAVGRLIQRKGFRFLIEAYAKLDRTARDWYEVHIAGEGPEMEYLRRLARGLGVSSGVKFLGARTTEELIGEYSKAEIFVMPSLNEGMSNAVLEAMACELPVIGSNIRGIKDIIENGRQGFLFTPGNVRELVRHLMVLTRDHDLRSKMGRQAKDDSKAYLWSETAGRYKELYEAAVRRRRL